MARQEKRAASTRSGTALIAGRRRGWRELSSAELLGVRLAELDLQIEGSLLEQRLEQLDDELARAGLRFRPYAWLSTDWFTPDGTTGFAVPFYLADPRLVQLERRKMLEVEGGTKSWCMKILRHEAAHALDNAYRLRRRKRWREVFGPVSRPYRSSYRPDPGSRDFVVNLDYWYAQSHPLEDFAETFAVWLRPGGRWKRRYQGWAALRKLEYVDELMQEVGQQAPRVRTRAKIEPLEKLDITLEDYYARKQSVYQSEMPDAIDPTLRRLFSDSEDARQHESAVRFLQSHRSALRTRIANLTGQQTYVVDQVVNELILRCKKLDLRLARSRQETIVDTAILLSTLTMNFVYGGHPNYQR